MFPSISKKRLLLIVFLSVLIWIVINQYLFCPSFSYPHPQPFSGSSFYNPYDSCNSDRWVKCNFHAHTNAWYGITNGRGTAKDVYHVYDSMNYAVHCVSDYQRINNVYASTPDYIPTYEHGYNAGKTHQLVLGSSEVEWLDYLLPQLLNNKQDVLNHLAGANNIVIVNHPSSFHGYNASDFRYLTNYQCMEVLNPYAISMDCWDTALSNGKPVFIVGNDDEHNIFSKNCVAKMCTWINVTSTNQKPVLNALRKGECYGMILGKDDKALPVLNYLKIMGDTIVVKMSETANHISFVGQNGKILKVINDSSSAFYIIKPGDHYVRTVIDYPFGRKILLNPVFRYNKTYNRTAFAQINLLQTSIKRISGLLIFVIWIRIAIPFVFLTAYRRKPALKSLLFR